MGFLSVMSKGTTEEKIMWSFDFLDLDRNGYIEKQEMLKVKLKLTYVPSVVKKLWWDPL